MSSQPAENSRLLGDAVAAVPLPPTIPFTLHLALAWLSALWYTFIWVVCLIGYIQIRKKHGRKKLAQDPNNGVSCSNQKALTKNLPFISILRPIKGVDPHLTLALDSTFLQNYPSHLHEILFCVASPRDLCIPIVRSLIARHPGVSARLVVGEDDVGPNPKIRTLSKAYREAKGDIVWLLDSNIWVARDVLARSVKLLCGFDQFGEATRLPYKFVHHLPIGVDCVEEPLLDIDQPIQSRSPALDPSSPIAWLQHFMSNYGGALEETFLSTSHSKFYTAINTIAIAPCTLGKSNMFRKSHLAAITAPDTPGILDFAHNICEDHMLAERIWVKKLQPEIDGLEKWGKHALGPDLVFQPIAHMGIKDYCERRTRWLRVRKYAVIAATVLEPGTESFLCSLIGGYGFVTIVKYYNLRTVFMIPDSWYQCNGIVAFWIVSIMVWSLCDYLNFKVLRSFEDIPLDHHTPRFIRNVRMKLVRRKWEASLMGWCCQWLGREMLALPLFLWAMLPGDVWWRGRRYRVGWNMKVEEVGGESCAGKRAE